jgi:RNA polymerase sigma factor (sigma-70 family)
VTLLARRGDEQLAGLVAKGNQQAFAVLYERYHQQLYRYCRSILHDDVDAQDALQSTMTAALVALQGDRRLAPVRPWLYRIAHNESISLLRRRTTVDEALPALEPLSASAEERAGERARFAGLMADLAELPERQRAALLMRELSGLSHEEIAVALQTSEGAAKQAIFDARRALLEFAEGRAMECDAVRRVVSDGDGRVLRGRTVRGHLRDCAGCQAFAAAIPGRRAELHAVVPLLAAPASAALLTRVLAAGSGNGAAAGAGASVGAGTTAAAGVGGSEGGGSTLITLAASKAAATTIGAKLAVGAAVLATGFAGVAAVRSLLASPATRTGVNAHHRAPDRGVRRLATIGNNPGSAASARSISPGASGFGAPGGASGTGSATGSPAGALNAPSGAGATGAGGSSTNATGGANGTVATGGTPSAGGSGGGAGASGTGGSVSTTGAGGTGNGGGAPATGSPSGATPTTAPVSGGSTGTGSGSGTGSGHGHHHGHGRGQGHGSGGLGPPTRSTSGGSGNTSSGGSGSSGTGASSGPGNSGHSGATKPEPPNGGGPNSSEGTTTATTTTGDSTTAPKPRGK